MEMYQRNERKEKVQKGQRERQTYRARGRLESIAQVTPTEDEVGLQDKEWVSIYRTTDGHWVTGCLWDREWNYMAGF